MTKRPKKLAFDAFFNPAAIKIIHVVVFLGSKRCGLVSRYQGRPCWWKHNNCPKRYSDVSTKLSGLTIMLNTVVRSLIHVVKVFS
jgi:hypothetical protein